MKTIIFDAYGTLISTGTGSVDAAGRILARNGREDIPAKDFYARWKHLHRLHMDAPGEFVNEETIFHMDLRALYAEFGFSRNADEDVELMLETLNNRAAFPESREVLEQLGRDHVVCIGSTTDSAPLMQNLERNALRVHRVFTSEGLRTYKPRHEFYDSILEQLKIPAPETLFVGDSLVDDVEGPQRVGMRACWINRRGAAAGDFAPDYEIRDLRELFNIVYGRNDT